MSGSLLNNFEVFFEGLPEPVYYRYFYPMGEKNPAFADYLWKSFRIAQGLKIDKDPEKRYFNQHKNDYVATLKALFNSVIDDEKGKTKGVITIPSSNSNVVNRVTELVREVLSNNPQQLFKDLTYNFTRKNSKQASHQGGKRSISENYSTLKFSSKQEVKECDVIIVIDDIITSGNSFRTVREVLRDAGFEGEIINFAFARTFPSEGAELMLDRFNNFENTLSDAVRFCNPNNEKPINALVFDLDQTLINDSIRNISYEESVSSRSETRDFFFYQAYEEIESLLSLNIPCSIVSNRPRYQIKKILTDSGLKAKINWPYSAFSFPVVEENGYPTKFYKPSPRGVNESISWLEREYIGRIHNPRIVGLGNTLEDIIAYKAAGIESALALWGVPKEMRNYAKDNWRANYAFDTVSAFKNWLVG